MKRRIRRTWRRKTAALAAAFMAMSFGGITHAMPQDGTIRSGEGNITRPDDKTMTIDQKTDRLAIDWKGFDVQNGERVHFNQPDARAIALNRVTGDAKSVIDGQLTANGHVYVINPNGVLFGRNASVDVGSLIASTANVSDDTMKNFAGSKDPLTLTLGDNSTAQVINEGTIKAQGGLVALHAASVENDGTIANEGGKVALAAAKNITLSEDTAGKINFTVDGALAKASTLNSGVLRADGGYVVMTAKQAGDVMSTVVNNTGTIEAKTLRQNEKGEILLDGGNNGVVEVSGTIDASGLENNQSAGSIKVIGNTTTVHDGTNLLARGTIDGGKIETSGDVLNLGGNLNIDAKGINGKAGEWLLDPLNVYIVAQADIPSDGRTITSTGTDSIQYADPTIKENVFANGITYISSEAIQQLLNNDTNVTIQAVAVNKAASITINAPIEKTAGEEATFQLEAQRSIIVNKKISASNGKLNINLYSDTDGDSVGVVEINADINTNGGNLKFGSGGDVKYTDSSTTARYNQGTLTGSAKPTDGTVGTYFGHVSGETGNRTIRTNGGAINLYGDASIGLNGDTLILNTIQDADKTKGGAVTVTGTVDSGNAYQSYMQGDSNWDDLVASFANTYGIPYYWYTGINYDVNGTTYTKTYEKRHFAAGVANGHYIIPDEGTNSIPMRMTANTSIYHTDEGDGYAGVEVSVKYASLKDKYGVSSYSDLTDEQKAEVSNQVAHNWFAAQIISQGGIRDAQAGVITSFDGTVQKGPTEVGGSYLATLATVIENSLVAPSSSKMLFVGGRGSGIRGRTYKNDQWNPYSWVPSDPNHTDGFYWVTGPEGEANNGTGTKFWDTTNTNAQKDVKATGSPVDGYYNKWTYDTSQKSYQPDNSGTFFTVGYGADSNWDDSNPGGTTVNGFVKETNLAHSGLSVQAGNGEVKLEGDIGHFDPLNNLAVSTTGNVTTGVSNSTNYNNRGSIFVDNNVNIAGAAVGIGDRITSGIESDGSPSDETNEVSIMASGDLTVNGITARGKSGTISLISTGTNSKITLGSAHNDGTSTTDDGTLTSGSTAENAVVIDAQGTSGSFVNATSKDAKNAITTGTGGSWKIYSASPALDTFGANLNSGTDAMWTSKSNQNKVTAVNAAGVTLSSYATTEAADENASGKYIFQTTPTITISADNYTKVYGDTSGTNTTMSRDDEELTSENMYKDLNYREEYTKSDGKAPVDVSSFSNAFQEKDLKSYIAGTVTVSSRGSAADATRTNGDIAGTDKNKSIYNVNVNIDAVGLNGHLLKKEDGRLTITPKALTVSGTGEQTYGNSTVTKWTDTTTGTLFGAKVSYDNLTGKTPTIKTDSSYDTNRTANHSGESTADAGDYQDVLDSSNFSNIKISDADGEDMSANYTVTTTGDLKVKPAELVLTVGDAKTEYGTAFGEETHLNNKHYDYTVGTTVNGDTPDAIKKSLGDLASYTNLGVGTKPRVTQDVGTYNINGTLSDAQRQKASNYTIMINPGKATITPKKITISTPDITTEYGTVKPGSGSSLTGLTNGDENDTTGLVYDYTYGNGYLDHDTRTNNLGDYTVTTDVSGRDYLKNYEITPGKSNLHIDPKDVYVRVDGKGNTTQDITYVDPDIDSKLSYGDHATWTPNLGGQTGEFTYDVITDINGHPFNPGESEVIGNYRFHYDGVAVVSPSKPDIDPPVVPPVVPGNGGYTLPTNPQTPSEKESGTVEKDWGTRDEGPGVDRERHIIKVQLPFFKIDDGKMTNYGTYDVKSQAAKVDISPTGKRLPEPNQPKTQYREYTKDITTSTGTGEFRLIYNGSTFHVMPLDAAARTMMQTGDEKHNIDLFAQALHIGFSEMGILPADLDGVYANFQDIAADAQNNSK